MKSLRGTMEEARMPDAIEQTAMPLSAEINLKHKAT
jgi:hypothetical protein